MSSTLAPRSLFRDLEAIRNQFNEFFSDVTDGQRMTMPVDLQETETAIVVKASVPGVKPEDLTVTVHQGVLSISGESREEHEETKGTWHLRERRAGSLYRSLTLPMGVDEAKAEAKLADGVLEITLPKTETHAAHTISVQPS